MATIAKDFFASIPDSLIVTGPQAIYLNRSPANAAIFWTIPKIFHFGINLMANQEETSQKKTLYFWKKTLIPTSDAWIIRVSSIGALAGFTFCAQRAYFASPSVIIRGFTYGVYSVLGSVAISFFCLTIKNPCLDWIDEKSKSLDSKKWEFRGIKVATPRTILYGITLFALTALTKRPILASLSTGCIGIVSLHLSRLKDSDA